MFTQETNRKLITRELSNADCLLSVLCSRCWLQPKRHEIIIPVGTNCKRKVAVLQHWSKKCKYCNGLYTVLIVLFIMHHRKLVGTGIWTHSEFLFWNSGRSLTHNLTHTFTYLLTHPLTQTLTFIHTLSDSHTASLPHSRTHSRTLTHSQK